MRARRLGCRGQARRPSVPSGRGRVLAGLAAFALMALVGWTGCAQVLGGRAEIRERRKFIMEAEPLRLNLPLSERPYELKVQIQRFAASRLYDRDQIIYRLSPEEIRDDRYNLWAARPGDMITNAIADYLRQARLFTDLREEFLDTSPDFTLTGAIEAIERFDSGDRWFARLAVTMQLVDRQNQIFWQHRFDPSEAEVFDPDLVYTVQALRGLLLENMAEGIRSLDRALLIRKMHLENRDLSAVLDPSATAATAAADTSAQVPRETADYVVVPGKLAPEANQGGGGDE